MISIDVNGAAAELAFSRAPELMLKHLRNGIHRGAQELARAEKEASPKAFGTMANSIKPTRTDDLSYRVDVGVSYAAGIEFGTEPGAFPPIQSILEWLRVKRIEPQDAGTSARDLAFLIARGIREHGIKASPFFYPTTEKMTPRVHDLVRAALGRGVSEALA